MCGGGRARKVWKEIVPCSAILFPVEFTKSMKLPKINVSLLKEKYGLLRGQTVRRCLYITFLGMQIHIH